MSKFLIIGDSGHAEKVPGKEAPDKSLREYIFNTEVDAMLEKRCKDHDMDYYRTNPSPSGKDEIGLSKRTQLANGYWKSKNKPKALFVSLHANAYSSGFNAARGTETFVASNASSNSKNAAQLINNSIYDAFKSIDKDSKNRGVKTSDFTVIYKANMPAILVEYGFYSNKEDLNILKNNKFELVEATMRGICKYFGVTYKEPIKESITGNAYYRVVTGSYTSRDLANREVEKLKSIGVKAFLDAFSKDGKNYLRVVAGSYTERLNADKQVKELELKGYKPFIAIYKK